MDAKGMSCYAAEMTSGVLRPEQEQVVGLLLEQEGEAEGFQAARGVVRNPRREEGFLEDSCGVDGHEKQNAESLACQMKNSHL